MIPLASRATARMKLLKATPSSSFGAQARACLRYACSKCGQGDNSGNPIARQSDLKLLKAELEKDVQGLTKEFEIHKISVERELSQALFSWLRTTIYVMGFCMAVSKFLDPSLSKGPTPEPSAKFDD